MVSLLEIDSLETYFLYETLRLYIFVTETSYKKSCCIVENSCSCDYLKTTQQLKILLSQLPFKVKNLKDSIY